MDERGHTQIWITKAHRGDALAVSKLLAAYHPMLLARAEARMDRTLRARSEPEDLLQQVYLEVFRRIDQFEHRGPNSFINWVLTILDNKLTDAARALHRQMRDIAREMAPGASRGTQSYVNLLDHVYQDSTTPSRVIRHDEAIAALLTCVTHLPESHRQVIQLRFLEGRSVNEVAERLNKTPGAVVALTRRALEALREYMDRMGDFTRGV